MPAIHRHIIVHKMPNRPFRLKGALKRCMTGLIDLENLGNPRSKMTKAPKKEEEGLSSNKKFDLAAASSNLTLLVRYPPFMNRKSVWLVSSQLNIVRNHGLGPQR